MPADCQPLGRLPAGVIAHPAVGVFAASSASPRGLCARQAVPAGTPLVQVAGAALVKEEAMTEDAADRGAVGVPGTSSSLRAQIGRWVSLACHLVLQRAAGAVDPSYLASLPAHASLRHTLPVLMSANDGPDGPFRRALIDRQEMVSAAFADAVGRAPALVRVPIDEFLWGYGVVSSRSFAMKREKTGPVERVLVPIIDLANHRGHSPNAQVGHQAGGRQVGHFHQQATDYTIALRASAAIAEGEEITISYDSGGCEGRAQDFLLQYGFYEGHVECAPMPIPPADLSNSLPFCVRKELDESAKRMLAWAAAARGPAALPYLLGLVSSELQRCAAGGHDDDGGDSFGREAARFDAETTDILQYWSGLLSRASSAAAAGRSDACNARQTLEGTAAGGVCFALLPGPPPAEVRRVQVLGRASVGGEEAVYDVRIIRGQPRTVQVAASRLMSDAVYVWVLLSS